MTYFKLKQVRLKLYPLTPQSFCDGVPPGLKLPYRVTNSCEEFSVVPTSARRKTTKLIILTNYGLENYCSPGTDHRN